MADGADNQALMTADDIRRTLDRIAQEILEGHRGTENLALIGIRRRGVPLARRLAARIAKLVGEQVPVGILDITLYRDDLSQRASAPQLHKTELNFSVHEKRLVLVDDVLYTGRTVRAAMDACLDLGRPTRIQLAVLIDRGHRELPIRPDYVGRTISTTPVERVQVHLEEHDGEDAVWLLT